mgnify:CR=1 FL=1
MSNLEKYKSVFSDALDIEEDSGVDIEKLVYNEISNWDSVGHLRLVTAIEKAFKVSLATDDVLDFSSFEKGKEILKKYEVEI